MGALAARLTACFALLLASAVLRAGEQSPQVIAAPAATTDCATLDRYCVTCHNSRTRTGGLALDTVDVAGRTGRRDVGKGRSQGSRAHDAAAGDAASR